MQNLQPLTKCYLKTSVLIVGKKNGAEDWISAGCIEYEKRLSSIISIETSFLKSSEELIKAAKSSKGVVYALDESGDQLTSTEFSTFLYNGFEKGGAHVTFLIGGFSGLPQEIKSSHKLISLSRMTWTHQMARLLLVEQIYRASEIRKGSSYHKE